MSAKIIEGAPVAEAMNEKTAADVKKLSDAGRKVSLVAVQVGENPASKIYTNMQAKSCEEVGIEYDLRTFPDDISQEDILAEMNNINNDPTVTGVILQMPLPSHLDTRTIQQGICEAKDVEGMHPGNMGKLFYGGGVVSPCTAMAAVVLLISAVGGKEKLAGLETVVVGHSEIVGKPAGLILLQSLDKAPTVTFCHIATKDLGYHTKRADVVVVATGVSQVRWRRYNAAKKKGEDVKLPNLSPLISADMLKEGAIVIDVAINRIPKGFDEDGNPLKNDKGKNAMQTVGDVDFDAAVEKVAAITPVPGGVGAVTVAMLLKNTVECAKALN